MVPCSRITSSYVSSLGFPTEMPRKEPPKRRHPGSQLRRLSVVFPIVPLLVLGAIWSPEIAHYHIPTVSITRETIEQGRHLPADSVLDELGEFPFMLSPAWDTSDSLVRAAEQILRGIVNIPGLPPTNVKMPFDADDIDKGLPKWQLPLAGLIVPHVLLQAYRITDRNDFLTGARDVIVGWAVYERSAWLSRGFLWNDHAVAARVLVVAEFWRLYRNHPSYQVEVAQTILQFMARSGELLSKSSHFTFATNHGVMQNLALLHLCVSFPSLPGVSRYRETALERLRDQMTFYISDEGVVLEHSADYHKIGLELIAMAFRYMSLLSIAVPNDWWQKYEKAQEFFSALRRPDGSLPILGDTDDTQSGMWRTGILVTQVDVNRRSLPLASQKTWLPLRPNSLYQISGYSVWWNGLEAWPNVGGLYQTVVAWSHFPGHGHKHADEMSVSFWAGGKSWWENVGYWPYDDPRRAEAASWGGSNAPHLSNESGLTVRETTLRFHGWSGDISMLDMERRGPGDYKVRRQIIAVSPNIWIVIDSAHGGNQQTTTTWTAASEVEIHNGAVPGSYKLKTADSRASLTAFAFGSHGLRVKRLRGSLAPFAGWIVVDGAPQAANAVMLEQPANNSWVAMLWTLNSDTGSDGHIVQQPSMQSWSDAGRWDLRIPTWLGVITVKRENGEIRVSDSDPRARPKTLALTEPTEISAGKNRIQAGYEQTKNKYPPRFRDLLAYRVKLTRWLSLLFLLQEMFFLLCARMVSQYYAALRVLTASGWVSVGIYLVLVYFQR